ncbi:unnamed protein product [Cuscuta europaea]|uniref:E3 ubiquitin-protein ligase RMA n=1 Tax=Cuscuta europaea TaxID=41803 RepID=A0A9P0YK84_CUSEU|nr:unnamed protein product [Cuscuta europaea]
MEDNAMNLDLNLGPVDHPNDDVEPEPGPFPNQNSNWEELLVRDRRPYSTESFPIDHINLEEFLDGTVREAVRQTRQRRQRWRSMWRELPVPPETRSIAMEWIGGSRLHAGEASFATPEDDVGPTATELTKICDNNNPCLDDETSSGKKEENENGNGDEGSFFDCNICLDLSKEPVVTCCGHLFCWPCLYRWLHVHSDAKECPVCKGEVTMKNVTPIYGRGSGARESEGDDSTSALKVPLRPQAHRVESWRQTIQRASFTIPMEEMIRRLGSRFDLSQVQTQNPQESPGDILNRFLTSRGRREQQNPHMMGVDDRDSGSSIAAVIHSESQTVDNAIEIDSTVSLSTSSSRRRNDNASRVSDVDSGDSRPLRRRRLN